MPADAYGDTDNHAQAADTHTEAAPYSGVATHLVNHQRSKRQPTCVSEQLILGVE